MLQRPDVGTEKILELATFIEGLEPGRFSMSDWGQNEEPRCICGWYQQLHGHIDKQDWMSVGDALGLDIGTSHRLFHHGWMGQAAAVSALRHLAVSGELP